MGTNFYRIVTVNEVMTRRAKLVKHIENMDVFKISDIQNGFTNIPTNDFFTNKSPWDVFNEGMSVHLGKRSGGWKFCWNFHNNKFYSNKEELLEFIRSGRVINEYDEILDNEEFIKMALEWEQPNGLDSHSYYSKNPSPYYNSKYDDVYIDGLRVSSSTEFS